MQFFIPSDDRTLINASLVQGLFLQKRAILVQDVRLDTFVANRNLGRLGLLKLDCEGAEPAVLHGSEKLLSEARPDVECEVLPPVAKELDKLITPWSYHKYLLTDDWPIRTERLEANTDHRNYLLTADPMSPTYNRGH